MRSNKMRLWALAKTVIALALAASLVSCAKRDSREFFDRTGRLVVIERPIQRIVSTTPSDRKSVV